MKESLKKLTPNFTPPRKNSELGRRKTEKDRIKDQTSNSSTNKASEVKCQICNLDGSHTTSDCFKIKGIRKNPSKCPKTFCIKCGYPADDNCR